MKKFLYFNFFLFLFLFFFLRSAYANTKVVCPSGTAGQNGCDYIGGDGIQAAVDALPQGSSTNKSKIIIKSGNYKRQNFTEFQLRYLDGRIMKRKCFIDTREKFLIFEGEGMPVLNGAESANMSGFCAQGGEIEIKGLVIKGFKRDEESCFDNDNDFRVPCSFGPGIFIKIRAKATITNNLIIGNDLSGIFVMDYALATVINNTISYNKLAGINLYNCEDDRFNPSLAAINNIITNNLILNSKIYKKSGFGIRLNCQTQNKSANDTFAYNLIWGNEKENTSCGVYELCENFTGRIGADPQFVNPDDGDFRLKSNSPAIDTGDPAIKDQDGSRSDMGAWGGPNPLPFVLNDSYVQDWYCRCLSSGVCHNSCPVNISRNYWNGATAENISYTKPMKCGLNNNNIYLTSPNDNQKNQFCQRYLRPKGDVNGDGQVVFLIDYLYYVQAFSGGKVASDINLDVNGDGEVNPDDGTIIRGNIQQ